MKPRKKSLRFCFALVVLLCLTVVATGSSYAQTVTIGRQGHSFCTDNFGINSGPNAKRLALHRWYAAMNSSANFDAATGSTGIAFDGADIWVANRDGSVSPAPSVVTAHRANNGEEIVNKDVYGFPANQQCEGPVALAYDGRLMWVVCRDNARVVRLSGIDGEPVGDASGTGAQPVFIEFVGNRMWVSNNGGNSLSIFNANPTYNLDFNPTDLTSPYGMASDGVNMWVSSSTTEYVAVYNLESPSQMLASYHVEAPSIDVAFDGANMWISHYRNDFGYEFGITILRASDGSFVKRLNTSDGVGNKPTYMEFDGIYVWVSNELDGTVSAFRVSDFQHVKTVNAGGQNSNPQQIAFDGANIWVANSGTGTISKR